MAKAEVADGPHSAAEAEVAKAEAEAAVEKATGRAMGPGEGAGGR